MEAKDTPTHCDAAERESQKRAFEAAARSFGSNSVSRSGRISGEHGHDSMNAINANAINANSKSDTS